MKITKNQILIIISLISRCAIGQIFVDQGGNVAEYSFTGSLINSSLITGVELLGSDNNGNIFTISGSGTIGEYTTSGAVVNASLIPNFGVVGGIAVSGGYIYIDNVNAGTVEKFTAAGTPVNASLITGLYYPEGLAINGNNLYVASGYINGVVGEYTTSGSTINASYVSGVEHPRVSVYGGDLYVTYNSDIGQYGGIDQFSLSGGAIKVPLISLQASLSGPAFDGAGNLFLVSDGAVEEYTTSGQLINPSLFTTDELTPSIVVVPTPEPSSISLALVGLTIVYFTSPLKRKGCRT